MLIVYNQLKEITKSFEIQAGTTVFSEIKKSKSEYIMFIKGIMNVNEVTDGSLIRTHIYDMMTPALVHKFNPFSENARELYEKTKNEHTFLCHSNAGILDEFHIDDHNIINLNTRRHAVSGALYADGIVFSGGNDDFGRTQPEQIYLINVDKENYTCELAKLENDAPCSAGEPLVKFYEGDYTVSARVEGLQKDCVLAHYDDLSVASHLNMIMLNYYSVHDMIRRMYYCRYSCRTIKSAAQIGVVSDYTYVQLLVDKIISDIEVLFRVVAECDEHIVSLFNILIMNPKLLQKLKVELRKAEELIRKVLHYLDSKLLYKSSIVQLDENTILDPSILDVANRIFTLSHSGLARRVNAYNLRGARFE